jgi:hypothetical protein
MIQPFKAGSRFADHARPIVEVMAQLKEALTEFANLKKATPGVEKMKADDHAYKGQVTELLDGEEA